ncbi:hypothetical protein [Clostridium luticellarii]|jgi:hypothetical protein|uniref:hypothetical protein n=1 Tax=Clostridium luticellarii TaxID=1691940 RepID=UPI0023520274|nr:hypothetical protein [Clostridium luticellarii]MCI1945592.1 hypothetical protein [Clostridium luticellarii]
MALSESALQAQRLYRQKWRERNREHIREYDKHWRDTHQENTRRYRENYWERKAQNLNPMNQFIKERCNLSPDLSTSNKQLAQAFNEWNNSSLTTSQFSLQFKDAAVELGLEKKRTKHGMIWQGVGLK